MEFVINSLTTPRSQLGSGTGMSASSSRCYHLRLAALGNRLGKTFIDIALAMTGKSSRTAKARRLERLFEELGQRGRNVMAPGTTRFAQKKSATTGIRGRGLKPRVSRGGITPRS
jgi:hypothetical protein